MSDIGYSLHTLLNFDFSCIHYLLNLEEFFQII